METEASSDQGEDDVLARFHALTATRERREREAVMAGYRQRIIDAAGIDPNKLSDRGQRILRWLSEWDDHTVAGIEELLGATRVAAVVADHRAEIARKVAALRQSEAATEAAMARYDQRWGQPR